MMKLRFTLISFSFIILFEPLANNSKEGLLPRGYEPQKNAGILIGHRLMAITHSNKVKL